MGADGKKNSDGNHVNDSSGIAADFGNDSNAAAVDALTDDGVEFARLFDHLHDFDAASLQLSQGDLLIVLAAFSYTMHVVRLGVYAPKTTALKLAASKATVEAYLSVLLVVGLAAAGAASGSSSPFPEFVGNMGSEVLDYFKVIGSAAMVASDETSAVLRNGNSLAVSVAAILWTGWVTCAYTIYGEYPPTYIRFLRTGDGFFTGILVFTHSVCLFNITHHCSSAKLWAKTRQSNGF